MERLSIVKALLLESIHPLTEKILIDASIKVETRTGALDEAELIDALQGVQLVGLRSKTEITPAVLDQAGDLQGIGAFCISTSQIALNDATQKGVVVFNAPFSNTRSVVELAIAEIIVMARQLTEKDGSLHRGVWDKNSKGSHEIRGRKLGIVGYGNIGSQLSVVAEMLGLQVYFYDIDDKLAMGNAHCCDSLEALLGIAEIISLHVDGRSSNAGFFGAEQFAKMRLRSLFLNLSRGCVVDYEALRGNLLSGHIAGASVDVFPNEPKKRGDAFISPLQGIPNVVLTPHIGGSTEEAQEDVGRFVATKLRDFAQRGTTTLSVNLPSLTLEERSGGRRISHLHLNTPGVLAKMNSILADHGVNIEGQLLNTKSETGYVVTDVAELPEAALADLCAMSETIRLRVID